MELKLKKISKYISKYFNIPIEDVFWDDFNKNLKFTGVNFYVKVGSDTLLMNVKHYNSLKGSDFKDYKAIHSSGYYFRWI
jgi:DNA-binding XRE family transcriptional regulator